MKVKNMLKILPAALLVAGISSNATAADGKALYMAKGCMACHGMDAKTPIMPVYPKLAGQNKDYAAAQMKDIKSGARNNGQSAAMKAIMASVSDEETAAIAEWLSGLAK
ncbi:c-type cytochrome [Candidatus Venteria ishoeyi]|uniref:Cytochrome c4 n=1 Tax=Candidatus Venteria ishoeyi TaxID=1899563 RepID=A0A1H6F5H5_9GAMM|nr:c-type cytochrome [Candidatus Venteria ishoeyi]SEH04641.1 Cytochrome c4 precursor [Candidatus Venteria ishoeyi]